MSQLKTQENNKSVAEFITSVDHKQRQKDAETLLALLNKLTGKPATMWGTSIIGFGKYSYQNTGKGGQWPIVGFSPRKTALTLYIMNGFSNYQALLNKLGKHKVGKSCLYINKLDDIDMEVLTNIICESITEMKAMYQCE